MRSPELQRPSGRAAERPHLTATIGIVWDTRRATRANLRGLPNDSRYSRATCVCGSCSQYSSRSLPDRSALLPTDTNDDSPTPSLPAASMIAIPSPPLCDKKPDLPGIALGGANVALRRTSAAVLSTPRQLGPTNRIPASRHTPTSSRCRRAPSAPISLKPAEMTSSARTPTEPHSRATGTTCSAGTTTTARSTGPGIWVTERYAGRDWTTSARLLTAYTRPLN
jgi:hypothetical protein